MQSWTKDAADGASCVKQTVVVPTIENGLGGGGRGRGRLVRGVI